MNPILISGVFLLALLCQGNATKISFKAPAVEQPPPPQPQVVQYYPTQSYYRQENFEQQHQLDLSGVKGGQPAQRQYQPIYPQVAQPQTIAYVVLRPVPQYPFVEQAQRPVYPQQPLVYRQQTKGGQAIRQEPPIQQQQEIVQQSEPQQPQLEESHEPLGKGKFFKLKSHLDKLAASAKAKLTLGSSYQVVSEELVTQPPREQQQQKEEIPEQEPENIRDAGEQQIQQQQVQQTEQVPEEPRQQAKGVQQVESFKRESNTKQAVY